MDDLVDLIAKIRLDQSNIIISRDSLKEIIDVLDDQGSNHITLEAFLQFVFDREVGHAQQPPAFKTPPESPFPENLESPQFTFRTPMKPFTPFPMTDGGKDSTGKPSAIAKPSDGPFSLTPEDMKSEKLGGVPSKKEASTVNEEASSNPPTARNASVFWGAATTPRFKDFAEEIASNKAAASMPQNPNDSDDAFNFSTWKDFKFELGAATDIKKKSRTDKNKPATGTVPTQPSMNPTAAAKTEPFVPSTSRTERSTVSSETEVPMTSRSVDSGFKVHTVQPGDRLQPLTEDNASGSDSTHSGDSRSSASTFTKYVFEDMPGTARSSLGTHRQHSRDNTTTTNNNNHESVAPEEDLPSSDDESEMSIDDMQSPFGLTEEQPKTETVNPGETTAQKEKENNPDINVDTEAAPSGDKLKTQAQTQTPSTSTSSSTTTNPFEFPSKLDSTFAGLNLGGHWEPLAPGSFSFNMGTGSSSSTTSARQPHIKKMVQKKKDTKTSPHMVPPFVPNVFPSQQTSSSSSSSSPNRPAHRVEVPKAGAGGGLFSTSPFVVGTSTGAAGLNGSDAAGVNGDAPPVWWADYQTPRPTSAPAQDLPNVASDAQKPAKIQPEDSAPDAVPTSTNTATDSGDENSSNGSSSTRSNGNTDPTTTSSVLPEGYDKTLSDIVDVYSKQGKQWYSMGQYDRALGAYTYCLNLAPKDWIGRATITGNRAAVNFMLNRYMESVDDCDDALRMDPTLVKLHIRKGKALIRLGHFNPADTAFWKLLQANMKEFRDIVSDEDYLAQLEQTLASAKLEAQAGMREVVKLKDSMNKLIAAESKKDYAEGLKVAEDILHRAPFARNAIEAKARALCELQRFDTAKEYMEEITALYPANLRAVHAHAMAPTTCPDKTELHWTEVKAPPAVVVSLPAIKRLCLCMGSSMAMIYLQVLKNHVLSKNCSADVMLKMFGLLEMLSQDLPAQDLMETWAWVPRETAKLRELLSLKQTADQQFKEKSYRASMQSYTQALRMDGTAKRWNAILHCNRAACHMCLNMYAEAVNDCNNAIQLYPEYHRAYLRRARAYRAMDKYTESVRDYRRYLCSDPVPVDFTEVQKELDAIMEEKAAETLRQQRQEQQRQEQLRKQQQQQQQQQQRPSSAKTGGSSQQQQQSFPFPGGSKTAGGHSQFHRPRSAQFQGGRNTWHGQFFDDEEEEDDDDDEDDVHQRRFQQQQQYQRFREGNANADGYYRGSSSHRSSRQPPQQQQHNAGTSSSYSQRPSTANGSNSSSNARGASGGTSPRPGTANGSGTSSGSGSGSSSTKGHGSTQQQQQHTTLFSLQEKDHYTILGVDTAASERDIKIAYRKLALQFHPDKNKDAGAEDRFKMIALAYSVLVDKGSRREYDLSRPLPRSSRHW